MAAETELERLVVRLIGDAEQYEKMLQEAQAKTQEAASKIEAVGEKLEGFANAAAAAIGAILAGMSFKEVLDSFYESEMAVIRLEAVLEANGRVVEELSEDYREWATSIQQVTVHGDEMILGLAIQAESFGLTGDAAKKAATDALAFAAINNSSAEAMIRVTAAMAQGDTERAMMFSRMIPQLRGVKNETEFLAKYEKLVAAGAEVMSKEAQTASGRMKQLKEAFGDLMELVGGFVANFVAPVVTSIKSLVKWLQELSPAVHQLAAGLLTMVAGAGVVTAIVKAFGALKSIIVSTFTTLMAHPFVALAAAIGGVVYALSNMRSATSEVARLGIGDIFGDVMRGDMSRIMAAHDRDDAARARRELAGGIATAARERSSEIGAIADPQLRERALERELERRRQQVELVQQQMAQTYRAINSGTGDHDALVEQFRAQQDALEALMGTVRETETSLEGLRRLPGGMSFEQGLRSFDALLLQTQTAIENMGMSAEEVQRNQLAQVLDPERIQQLDEAMARLTRRRESFQLGQDAQGMLRTLQEQYDTFGMTARQADVYRLRLRDVSNEHRAAIDEIERMAQALDDLDAANKETAKSAQGLADALKGLDAVRFGSLEALARTAVSVNIVGGPGARPLNANTDQPREMVRLLGRAVTHLEVIARRDPVTFERGGIT